MIWQKYRRALWLMSVATALACANERERPPPPSSKGNVVDNPRSCREIQQGSRSGAEIQLAGDAANCAVDGLACPLGSSPSLSSACHSQQTPYALCANTRWVVTCNDAGAGVHADASLDGALGD